MRRPTTLLIPRLIPAALLGLALATGTSVGVRGLPEAAPVESRASISAKSFLFHAALEGLYTDGVSTEVVEAMAESDGEMHWPKYFIYACPVCHPVYDALLLYKGRKPFLGAKDRSDTFGAGLSEPVKAALTSPDAVVRLEAIKARVATWIQRRVELLRLDEEERAELARDLSAMREKGTAYQQSYREQGLHVYAHIDYCPSCDGATMGAGR